MLKNQALRGDMMRGHAQTIEAEINRMVGAVGRRGRDRPARLVRRADHLHDASLPDREAVPRGARRVVRPALPRARARHRRDRVRRPVRRHRVVPPPRRRPRAAGRAGAGDHRQAQVARGKVPREERDLLDVLISIDMSADYITGIFISMMFAGHHTSSGTAAWALIELMRHPEVMKDVVAELDDLYADGSEISFQALRSIPRLESALKETLRLHPPLIILLRVVQEEIELAGHTIPPGHHGRRVSPRVSNRIAEDFPEPGPVRPGPLPRPAPGGPAEPLDLDPVRRRQAPLRRQRVRDDAAQGDLLGDPARLRVRAGPAVARPTATTSPRWSSSSPSRAGCATAAVTADAPRR